MNNNFKETTTTSEMIACTMLDIYMKEVPKTAHPSILFLVFEIYDSWAYSYILSACGKSDVAHMTLRRSIESICYLAKIVKSSKRAEIWMHQTENTNTQLKFKSLFRIPDAYAGSSYKHLRSLIYIYDFLSTMGIHANFELVSQKWIPDEGFKKLTMSSTDQEDEIPFASLYTLVTGFALLQSLRMIISKWLKQPKEFDMSLSKIGQLLRASKIEVLNHAYKGNIPLHVRQNAMKHDIGSFEKEFETLIKKNRK